MKCFFYISAVSISDIYYYRFTKWNSAKKEYHDQEFLETLLHPLYTQVIQIYVDIKTSQVPIL
jgi:hypothetical protein